jgi:predicted GNAT family acetyltransferase
MDGEILNLPGEQRFVLEVEGYTAEVVYRLSPGVVTFVHTGVPEELAGRGIASRLARHVLDYARLEGLRVELRCSFLRGFVASHAEYRDLLI